MTFFLIRAECVFVKICFLQLQDDLNNFSNYNLGLVMFLRFHARKESVTHGSEHKR